MTRKNKVKHVKSITEIDVNKVMTAKERKKALRYSWTERVKITLSDTYAVSMITLKDGFVMKLLISLFAFSFPFVLGIILVLDPTTANVAAYYSSITGSLAIKLFFSIFEQNSFEKNRTLYLQFTPLSITLGKLMREWVIFIFASLVYIAMIGTFVAPFHRRGGFLMTYWTGAVLFGFLTYLVGYVIMRVIFSAFKSRPAVVASQILFVILILVLGNFLIKIMSGVAFVDANGTDKDGAKIFLDIWTNAGLGKWIQKYDRVIMFIPVLNSRLFENIHALESVGRTWTIAVAFFVNFAVVLGLLWFVVPQLEKKRLVKLW